MWVCSAMNRESKPRSSIDLARSPGAIPSSVTNVEMPNFMSSLNHTESRSGASHNPSLGSSFANQGLGVPHVTACVTGGTSSLLASWCCLVRRGDLLTGLGGFEYLGEPLVGAKPLVVVVDVGGYHDFVCFGTLGELLDAFPHAPRITDDLHRAIGIG